jgi:hypothetical protein
VRRPTAEHLPIRDLSWETLDLHGWQLPGFSRLAAAPETDVMEMTCEQQAQPQAQHQRMPPPPPSALPQHRLRQQVGARAIDRGTSNAYVRDGGTSAEVIGSLVGLDADIHLRRYTQITQRHQLRGGWTGRQKSEQLKRLKYFYADPLTPRGELDPHRFLGQRVADTFEKDNHTT